MVCRCWTTSSSREPVLPAAWCPKPVSCCWIAWSQLDVSKAQTSIQQKDELGQLGLSHAQDAWPALVKCSVPHMHLLLSTLLPSGGPVDQALFGTKSCPLQLMFRERDGHGCVLMGVYTHSRKTLLWYIYLLSGCNVLSSYSILLYLQYMVGVYIPYWTFSLWCFVSKVVDVSIFLCWLQRHEAQHARLILMQLWPCWRWRWLPDKTCNPLCCCAGLQWPSISSARYSKSMRLKRHSTQVITNQRRQVLLCTSRVCTVNEL